MAAPVNSARWSPVRKPLKSWLTPRESISVGAGIKPIGWRNEARHYRTGVPSIGSMRKNRFVTITIWVVVIGMVLSLSLALVGAFQ